jgi:hypothetical protein
VAGWGGGGVAVDVVVVFYFVVVMALSTLGNAMHTVTHQHTRITSHFLHLLSIPSATQSMQRSAATPTSTNRRTLSSTGIQGSKTHTNHTQ